MSPAYNKGPVPVVPYAPNPGSGVYPLAVHGAYGLSTAAHTFVGAGNIALLAAPPAGQAYLLGRIMANASVAVDVTGTTSGFLYGASLNGVPDNMAGQIVVGEGITIIVSGAAGVYLTLDVVQIPHIQ